MVHANRATTYRLLGNPQNGCFCLDVSLHFVKLSLQQVDDLCLTGASAPLEVMPCKVNAYHVSCEILVQLVLV